MLAGYDGSSREDVNKALAKINEKYEKLKGPLVDEELSIVMKMGYCGAFTTYCCLCTAFTSCCIGPYFIQKYAGELVEKKQTFDVALNDSYMER